jgi:hypothetical protein
MHGERIANIRNIRDWSEPAHPSIVKLNDDLVSIYSYIREKYQEKIDNAFDRVSRQIGFIVATSLPLVVETGKKGAIKSISIGAEHLKDTLFDKELSSILRSIESQDPDGDPAIAGLSGNNIYHLQLVWFEALKLKLRTDWIEPAHFLRGKSQRYRFENVSRFAGKELTGGCEWCEPAHWFDPGIAIGDEEIVIIEAIDKVYPELQLGDRVAYYREMFRRASPSVMEPAHYQVRTDVMEPAQYQVRPGVMEPAQYQVRPGVMEPAHYQVRPGVMEPAHFRRIESEFLSELSTMLRKYGY